ncbi:MAG: IPT/TIG domain-containing protein, partial [Sedimentisphaerales bacterium]|nr:IPT/TIG domain-containing protein [Sedimentisphaerales bacterium]
DRMVFTVTSKTNTSPTISGVSGPTALKVSQRGTWTVKASDPNKKGVLNYSVIWGDEGGSGSGTSVDAIPQVQQTATFTHAYGTPGAYYPKFTVTNAGGLSAEASLSVKVGDVFPVARIISLSPASGPVDTQVTITGSGFTPTGNRVKFGNLGSENNPVYNLNSADGHTLTFNVPTSNYFVCWSTAPDPCSAPAVSTAPGVYEVSVITAYSTSNKVSFTVTSDTSVAPAITAINPTSGLVGTSVTITGRGFTPTGNRVNFGGGVIMDLVPAGSSATDVQTLTFTVPSTLDLLCRHQAPYCAIVAGPTTPGVYPVSVTNANGASNAMNFTVTAPTPTISVYSPSAGSYWPVNDPLSIYIATTNMPATARYDVVLYYAGGASVYVPQVILLQNSATLPNPLNITVPNVPVGQYYVYARAVVGTTEYEARTGNLNIIQRPTY